MRGFTHGGDDYVTKPFSLEELVARVRGVLRRSRPSDARPAGFADLELDEDRRGLARRRPIDLTPTEFRLLRYLLLNPRPGPVEVSDPGSRLALRLRRRRQRRRDLHQLPAQKIDTASRS